MIRFQAPQLPDSATVLRYFAAAERERRFSNFGPCHQLFEDRVGEYLGGLRCVPVANATLGLMVALRALSEGRPGRKVLVPSFTFAAVAASVIWPGFEPVCVDVDPDGWHLSPPELSRGLV